MKEIQSDVDENLILLEDGEAFAKHAGQFVERCRRTLVIFSESLDPAIYDQVAFVELVSALARGDRHTRVRILIKDIKPLVQRGHRLLSLSRRLSSKIEIRKLLIEPENDAHAYLIGDRDLLLYKHDDTEYTGFANYRAGPEANALLDVFNQLWEQHSTVDPSLRSLRI